MCKKETSFRVCLKEIECIYVACLVLKEATKHKCIEKLAEELIEKIESNFSDIEKIHRENLDSGKMYF